MDHTVCIRTPADFNGLVAGIQARSDWPAQQPDAWAIGWATEENGQITDIRFPHVNIGEGYGAAAVIWTALTKAGDPRLDLEHLATCVTHTFTPFRYDGDEHPNIDALDTVIRHTAKMTKTGRRLRKPDQYGRRLVPVLAWTTFDQPPRDIADAWLRLTLLSLCKMEPNSMNLDDIFGILPVVAWTSRGPLLPQTYQALLLKRRRPKLTLLGLDKFPRMVDYVLPTGVRVADADRVRLGAHLAPGTTVMHEGFVNFNAGTLGESMVEGRIAQGVVVDKGSDIGGGGSIMGTLSGGGKERVRIGRRSLLGANAGIGISLGDDCVVEAGLYLTAGTKVTLLPMEGSDEEPRVVAARELSGASGLLYWRNSLTGGVEARPRAGHGVVLNAALHAA